MKCPRCDWIGHINDLEPYKRSCRARRARARGTRSRGLHKNRPTSGLHKNRPLEPARGEKKRSRIILEAKEVALPTDVAMTGACTVQRELVNCGKSKCKKCRRGASHGPYWYAYIWRPRTAMGDAPQLRARLVSPYHGKTLHLAQLKRP